MILIIAVGFRHHIRMAIVKPDALSYFVSISLAGFVAPKLEVCTVDGSFQEPGESEVDIYPEH